MEAQLAKCAKRIDGLTDDLPAERSGSSNAVCSTDDAAELSRGSEGLVGAPCIDVGTITGGRAALHGLLSVDGFQLRRILVPRRWRATADAAGSAHLTASSPSPLATALTACARHLFVQQPTRWREEAHRRIDPVTHTALTTAVAWGCS